MADSDDNTKDKNQDNAQNKTKESSIKPGILAPLGAGITAVREFFIYRKRPIPQENPKKELRLEKPKKEPTEPKAPPKAEAAPVPEAVSEPGAVPPTEITEQIEFDTSVFLEISAAPNPDDKSEKKKMKEIQEKFEPMLTQHKESAKPKLPEKPRGRPRRR